MIKRIKYWMIKVIPSVHNLPHVIYIKWIDRYWYVRKSGENMTCMMKIQLIVTIIVFAIMFAYVEWDYRH